MALEDFEQAPEYQALVSTAIRSGRFRHAHVLRALTRSVNQLLLEGEPLLSLSWDSRESADAEVDEKSVRAVASPYWTRMLPGVHVCTKMPGLRRATFFVHAEIQDGARVYLQIETFGSSLDLVSDHPSGRVFELIGTGAEERYELEDVPITVGAYERIGFWIRGERTSTEGDGDVHGGSASDSRGQLSQITVDGRATVTGVVWNTPPAESWPIDHVMVVHDGPNAATLGSTLYTGQFYGIVDLGGGSYTADLFRPPYDVLTASALRNKYFRIFELPTLRLFSIDAYTQDSDGDGMRPTRKIHTHSRAPHVGYVIGNNLRNAKEVQKHRGRMLVQKNWVRNIQRPWLPAGFFSASENIDEDDYETFFVWHADVREDPDETTPIPRGKIIAHVCFTVNSELATHARLRMEVYDGSTTGTATAEVVLGSDASARIPEGALTPFESRGGSYEALIVIPSYSGGAVRRHTLMAYAFFLDTAEPPVADGESMRIDSVDLWMED